MKKYKPEQIVTLLRQIEVEIANGKTMPRGNCRANFIAGTSLELAEGYRGLRRAETCLVLGYRNAA
jgi:hypothetical protein